MQLKNNSFDYFINVEYKSLPLSKEIIVIACDELYFNKYGKYLIFSCDICNQNIHVHIINPSNNFFDIFEKLQSNLSIQITLSLEYFDVSSINFTAIKSYYFCARFFIAAKLFQFSKVENLHILDADCIVNQLPKWRDDLFLVLLYRPNYNNLWKKIMAGYVYVTKNKKDFLQEVTTEVIKRYNETDFNKASLINDKIKRSNLLGLDQVSLAYVFEKNKIDQQPWFANNNMIHKNKKSAIWYFVGDSKNAELDSYLKNKFKTFNL